MAAVVEARKTEKVFHPGRQCAMMLFLDINQARWGDVMSRVIAEEWIGREFGRLTIIGPGVIARKRGVRYWTCRCRCGTVREVRADGLISGSSASCGCLHREKSYRHGMARTPAYRLWGLMLHRCRSPKASNYARYGGRGICVCERWLDFANFSADMGPRPSPRHTIDRIDNDGDYEPGNCRWATRKEQGRNRRTTTFLTHDGQTRSLIEWSEIMGIAADTIARRLKRGWLISRAFSEPSHRNR